MTLSKKLLALLLVCVMVFSLSACTDFESHALKAAAQFENLESLRADYDVTLGVKMMGFMSLDLHLVGNAKMSTDPLLGSGDLSLDLGVLGDTMAVSYCFKEDADKLYAAVSTDGGETWSRSETDALHLRFSDIINFNTLSALSAFSSSFEASGTETVNGSEATVYSGLIKWADLIAMVPDPESLQSASEALGTDVTKLYFSIPVTIAIDNSTDRIVKLTLDLSELMQVFMPLVLQKAAEDDSLDEEAVEIIESLDFRTLVISVVLSDFNDVGEIEIPAAAFAA